MHTYFAGSDQNVFRGYKREVDALEGAGNNEYVYVLQKLGNRKLIWK